MAQQFKITVLITSGAVEEVSAEDVQESLQDVLDDFDGGTAEITNVIEM
jgi:hypothetical protein